MEEEEHKTVRSFTDDLSEQHNTYYYSKFDLFEEDTQHSEFYFYSSFLSRIWQELGEEWQMEAHALYHPHLGYRDVFVALLEVWMQYHPSTRNGKFNCSESVFSQTFLDDFKQKMERKLANLKDSSQQTVDLKVPPSISLKAVCMGFFMASNEIWEELLQDKPKQKSYFSPQGILKGVQKTIKSTFKPVMVVTEKINNVFGRKRRNTNENNDFTKVLKEQGSNSGEFRDCFIQFKKNLGIEKQLARKMSEINLDQQEKVTNSQTTVSRKAFKQEQFKLQNGMLSSLYDYVKSFLNRNHSWQVASNFVTNIFELNQVNFQQGMKVKVLRPAEDFYAKLVFVWLLLKDEHSSEFQDFEHYLEHVKSNFGEKWKEKYQTPTKYFFQRINKDWQSIDHCSQNPDDKKQAIDLLRKKLSENMEKQWHRKIKIGSNRDLNKNKELSQE